MTHAQQQQTNVDRLNELFGILVGAVPKPHRCETTLELAWWFASFARASQAARLS